MLRAYWRLRRPLTLGVRAIVTGEDLRVMLVRHTYKDGWYLPGGGVKRRETLVQALRRELREEVGVTCPSDDSSIGVLGSYSASGEGKRDHVTVFVVRSWRQVECRSREIAEVRLCDPLALPDAVSPATRRRLEEFSVARTVDHRW